MKTEDPAKDTDGYPQNGVSNCDNMASVGYWQYTQVIKVYDNINPIITFDAPDPFCSYSSDFDAGCPAEVSIDFTVDENCTPDDLTITIYLDAFGDGVLDGDITDLLSGTYPNYNVTGTFPLGAHIHWCKRRGWLWQPNRCKHSIRSSRLQSSNPNLYQRFGYRADASYSCS